MRPERRVAGLWSLSLMKTAPIFLSLCAGVVFTSGCSRQVPQQASVLTLAANDRGTPQFDYSGPGRLSYHKSFESFTFEISPVTGSPWATGKGEMKFSDSNHVVIAIQSSSDRAYDIELLGVWTNRTLDISEDRAKEKVRVPAGEQKLRLERFVIWTYDFNKEK